MTRRFTLPAHERLKSRKQLETLFQKGQSFHAGPVKVIYQFRDPADGSAGLQAGFGVSRRNFKRATDRNRVKRLLREAYRLQHLELEEQLHLKTRGLDLFLLYTGRELPEQAVIMEKTAQALRRLQKSADETTRTHP